MPFTLTANFDTYPGTASHEGQAIRITANVRVKNGSTNFDPIVIKAGDDTTDASFVDGVLEVSLPSPDDFGISPDDFGYRIARTGIKTTGAQTDWQVPAQAAGTTVDLSDFTETTSLPVPVGLGVRVDELDTRVSILEQTDPGTGIIQPSGDTTGATDHAAITAALAVSDVAVLGAGLWINAPILLGSGQALKGGVGIDQGNPNLHLAAGSNCHMVTLDGTPARGYLIENLVLDGHREDQGAGNWDGINLTGPVHGTAFGQCAVGRVENVMVQYAKRHGLYIDDHQVENRVADFYGFSCGVSSIVATGSDLWFERITSGESGGNGIVIDASDWRLTEWKSWWSGRQNAVRSTSNPATLGEGNARGLVALGSGHIDGGSCQDNSGPGVELSLESGYANIWLDGNAVGIAADYQMNAYLPGSTDSDITLRVGHTSGHAQTTYPIGLLDGTKRTQVRVLASSDGAVYPAQARPGSVIDSSTVLTFGPVAAGGGGGGSPTPGPDTDGLYPLTTTTLAVDSDGLYPIGA